jgi:uncharacterized membrane protein
VDNASEPSAFHRRSAPILVRLAAVPPWAFVVGLAVLLVVGLFLPGWPGAVVLLLLAAFLAWLAALSWSRLTPLAALVRGATIVLVVWAAAQKVT